LDIKYLLISNVEIQTKIQTNFEMGGLKRVQELDTYSLYKSMITAIIRIENVINPSSCTAF